MMVTVEEEGMRSKRTRVTPNACFDHVVVTCDFTFLVRTATTPLLVSDFATPTWAFLRV